MRNKIVITTGDVNGVGAEITLKALNNFDCNDFVLVSNSQVLKHYGMKNSPCEIIEVPFDGEIHEGKIDRASGEFSFQALKKACELNPKAIITAPVSKEALHLAGHFYNGQTEILEKFLSKNGEKAEMLFAARDFRVLLLTRHCALKDIKITKELIISKVLTLKNALNKENLHLAFCALNPHAGENGVIGKEENEIIIPAINELRQMGIKAEYPLPSDTLFIQADDAFKNKKPQPFDCYIAMYHDQGLIPMKLIARDEAVNVTIGLDILRTSPAHGTAFDIAGKNIANPNSMISAIKYVQLYGMR